MLSSEPPTDISEFECVDEYWVIEQDGYPHERYHVVFSDDLNQCYGRLLDYIRFCGYEVVQFGVYGEMCSTDDTRVSATFIENGSAELTWNCDEFEHGLPGWVEDLPL